MTTIEERTAARAAALAASQESQRRLARPEDYLFDKAQEKFWDIRDNTLHSEKAVDASIPIEFWRVEVEEGDPPPAPGAPRPRGRPRARRERLIPPSKDILRVENNQFVEGSTWWPGKDKIIHDMFIDSSGAFPAIGRRIFNQYREPPAPKGDPTRAGRWVAHVKKLWPDEREHNFFFDACAHMLQKPHEKLNAAIVLSGTQGIGKDAALAPVKRAVGTWNAKGIDPDELFSPYKPWLQTLMLVVDEVRPSKDEFHASSMYNILKPMIVAPPDTLPLNDKYQNLRHIINVLRVFITTNDWMAMYIPPEDRRMFIMHSALPSKWHVSEGTPEYFLEFFGWLDNGGAEDVAAWLAARDLSGFDAKAPVVKTAGWEAVATTWTEPEDAVNFAIDKLGRPDAILGAEMVHLQFDGRDEIVGMLKSPRKIGHRMMRAGYLPVAAFSPYEADGRWVFRIGERKIRTRYAFVRAPLAGDKAAVLAAVFERARAMCESGETIDESYQTDRRNRGAAPPPTH